MTDMNIIFPNSTFFTPALLNNKMEVITMEALYEKYQHDQKETIRAGLIDAYYRVSFVEVKEKREVERRKNWLLQAKDELIDENLSEIDRPTALKEFFSEVIEIAAKRKEDGINAAL